MVKLTFLLLYLIMAGTPLQQKKRVLFFGDSITATGKSWEGAYINKIAVYASEAGVDNYIFDASGVPGNRVTDLFLRMEDDVLSQQPDVVVMFIGTNDIWHKSLTDSGTNYEAFKKYYSAIIEKLQLQNIQVVVCTPACIGEAATNSLDAELDQYSKWIREYANSLSLPVVDLRTAFVSYNLQYNVNDSPYGVLTTDGVHLNPIGSELVAREMWRTLWPILIR